MSIIVLDTETTGLLNDPRASVIEIGAVCLHDGQLVSCFSSLVRPLQIGEWATPALEVSHLPLKALANAPKREVVWAVFLNWASLYKPVEKFLAYNVQFDREMMKRSWPEADWLPWGPCLMQAARRELKQRGMGGNQFSLARVTGAGGLVDDVPDSLGGHRALYDALQASRLIGHV